MLERFLGRDFEINGEVIHELARPTAGGKNNH